jgi:hypothetical protein
MIGGGVVLSRVVSLCRLVMYSCQVMALGVG